MHFVSALKRGLENTETARSREALVALRRIIRSIDLHSRAILQRSGVTGPQLLLLGRLAQLGEASVGELAEGISLAQATVTGILDRLERRGLVDRRRCAQDKRRVLVRVTPDGEKLLSSAPPLLQEHFLESFTRLHDWEQNLILSSLQRVVTMMEASDMDVAPILASGPISDNGMAEAQDAPPPGPDRPRGPAGGPKDTQGN